MLLKMMMLNDQPKVTGSAVILQFAAELIAADRIGDGHLRAIAFGCEPHFGPRAWRLQMIYLTLFSLAVRAAAASAADLHVADDERLAAVSALATEAIRVRDALRQVQAREADQTCSA